MRADVAQIQGGEAQILSIPYEAGRSVREHLLDLDQTELQWLAKWLHSHLL